MTQPEIPSLLWRTDTVHVFCLTVPDGFGDLVFDDAGTGRVLTPAEREKYDAYQVRHRKNELLLSRILLRVLWQRLGLTEDGALPLEYEALGKPFIAEAPGRNPIHLNPSDTDGRILWSLSPAGPLGCDIEKITREDDGVAATHFEPRETAEYLALDGEARRDRFFRLWTLKESLIKADGRGLGIPLDSFRFRFPGSDATPSFEITRPEVGPPPGPWCFDSFEVGREYRGAVAVQSEKPIQFEHHRLQLSCFDVELREDWCFEEWCADGAPQGRSEFGSYRTGRIR